MNRLLVLAGLVALAGCATAPQVPKEVKVEVPVYCQVDKPAAPAWATSMLKPNSDIFDQVKALVAERKQRIGYEGQLEAAIDGCQPPQK